MKKGMMKSLLNRQILTVILRILWLVFALIIFGLFLAGIPLEVKRLDHGLFGFSMAPEQDGILVVQIIPGQQADKAGLVAGDMILEYNHIPISTSNSDIFGLGKTQGRAGSTNLLKVQDPNGRIREVVLTPQHPDQLPLGLSPHAYILLSVGLDILYILGFFLLAGLINGRAAPDPFAVLVSFSLILISFRIPPEFSLLIINQLNLAWASPWLAIFGYSLIPLMLSLFPNGRWYPRYIWIYPVVSTLYGIWISSTNMDISFGFRPISTLIEGTIVGIGVLAQIARFRKFSNLQERQQTKWALFGIASAFLFFYLGNLSYNSGLLLKISPELENSAQLNFLYSIFSRQYYLVLLIIPVTLTFSILRSRLWEIDLIIRRTLIYTLLTGALAGTYFLITIIFERIFSQAARWSSSLAVVISTLVIAFLFAPLRRMVQGFIDRRFFRRKYDSERTLESFTAILIHQTDLSQLTEVLLAVIDETMQPVSLSVWLKPIQTRTDSFQKEHPSAQPAAHK
jgi:hypothetical protein